MTLMALKSDLEIIIDGCTCVGTVFDELTLLRTALRLYDSGLDPEDAVAKASEMLSDSLTQKSRQ